MNKGIGSSSEEDVAPMCVGVSDVPKRTSLSRDSQEHDASFEGEC